VSFQLFNQYVHLTTICSSPPLRQLSI
jgi:hypothetical protein